MAGSRHPSLHGAGEAGDYVSLRASSCTGCGRVVLPPERLGCRGCGADGEAQAPICLSGAGVVRASTMVHLDPLSSIDAPYAVARIALEAATGDMVVVDGLLMCGPVAADTPVRAQLVQTKADRLEVRFAAESSNS